MKEIIDYGVVYTPQNLSAFVARLLKDEAEIPSSSNITILDPACGEGALLFECDKTFADNNIPHQCIGIDVDSSVIKRNKKEFNSEIFSFYTANTILPSKVYSAEEFWKEKIEKPIDLIIANPPWSSDRIFTKDELSAAGYCTDNGQYDSYVLFIELSLKLLSENGLMAFIIPDSLFSGENKLLRQYLCENSTILSIARLGEKLFPDVFRATSVIVIKKAKPTNTTLTKCYRLTTSKRNLFLSNKLDIFDDYCKNYHNVLQNRFLNNKGCIFDIDATEKDERLLKKIELNHIDINDKFKFSRGVEISKSGEVTTCPFCNNSQGYSNKHLSDGSKICTHCGATIPVNASTIMSLISEEPKNGYSPIYVGENIQRYSLDGNRNIKEHVRGIDYKDPTIYSGPKLLIRKTGLGIYSIVDRNDTLYSQTVYSLKIKDEKNNAGITLEYFLGVLNSRVLYYYYLKKYGQNEWKSHPYLTKDIIFSLPIRDISAENKDLCLKIAKLAKKLEKKYSRSVDLEIEKLVMDLYKLNKTERKKIIAEINKLPDLSAINVMKLNKEESYV